MILEAKNLSKSFHSPKEMKLFSNLSFSVEAGETVAIQGRSGEGKTTLLHTLGMLEPLDSGELTILGKKFSKKNGALFRNKHIGFVFQSYNLLEDFTVLENVLMPSKIAREVRSESYGIELLKSVGLEKLAKYPARLLSGGEKQRAAIARALCNDPDLILADEPTGNLDQENAKIVGSLLLKIAKEKKRSLILVTHDFNLSSLCETQYTLSQGKLCKNQ